MGINFHIGVFALALVLLAVAYFGYFRTTPLISGPLRAFLTALRVGAFLLLIFLLMDPRFVRESSRQDPPRVIALVDRSASMSLPDRGYTANAGPTRFEAAHRASEAMRSAVESAGGVYQQVYFSDDLVVGGDDEPQPNGQGTDIDRALRSAHDKHEGENVAAIVLVTDGVETEERLVRTSPPPIPVFTVGVGDTSVPEDVSIKDVDYNSVVRAPSKTSIRATIHYAGDGNKSVRVRLTEDGLTLFEETTQLNPNDREIDLEIPVEFREPGRRRFELVADVDGYDAETENNLREVVIEAEKAGVRVLIVDLKPTWELRFLTDLLKHESTFDFDVITALGTRPTIAEAKLLDVSQFESKLDDYDALILGSIDHEFMTAGVASAIVRFVRERGRGLLVLPGPSSLFEHREAWDGIAALLPVQGAPPHRFTVQFTSVRPGAQAGTNPITAQLVPLLSQTDWQLRSPLLGYYSSLVAKSGVEILLETDGNRTPAFTYQTAGSGRVAVLSAGPIWRWKFLSENNTLYDEMVSRLVDVLTRGEETERFVLTARKNLFDSGETPAFVAEVFNERMQPVTGVPVRIEVTRVNSDGTEVPLDIVSMEREGADNPRFKAVLSPLPPGTYRVKGEAELQGRTLTSQPIDISVSDVSVEYRRVYQDRANLMRLARRSGGQYGEADDAAALVAGMTLSPRVLASTTELSLRTSSIIFMIVVGLLAIEWIIRKRVGMI